MFKGENISQGRDNARKLLIENPKLRAQIEKEVKETAFVKKSNT